MSQADMTTTKIKKSALEKLRMLAERESRSAPNQLDVLIDQAFRANPADLTDVNVAMNAFSKIIARSQRGAVSASARAASKDTRQRISWGQENGKVVGILADGSRCDVNGNVLPDTHLTIIR